ncbi:gluzincin family metallopeptidase [Zunongwangia mangrovi]|uniref:metalloprotease n=1 Tax=Zunongwangia mangrovi TaxID=1334022 RepID=UPI001FE19AF9|nr:metalloprotease [Zunongwangia mangrovi]
MLKIDGVVAQHQILINAELNKEERTIYIDQQLTYVNTVKEPIREIYLNDWANAFKDKNTPLARRFGEEYVRKFHFSKPEEKGYTSLEKVTYNNNDLVWIRPQNHPDILRVLLNKKLQPGEKINLKFKYSVKIPSDKFTRFGVSSDGNYKLKFWYLTPAVYDGEWKLYSHKDIGEQYTPPANLDIQLDVPTEFFPSTALNIFHNYAAGNRRHIRLTGENRVESELLLTQTYEPETLPVGQHQLVTNLDDDGLQPEIKDIILTRIFDFLQERLGEYPHQKILITKEDYLKNPVYGLNQLPDFIRPFPDGFNYDIQQLKTITNNFLSNSLLLDPQQDQWVHDAIAICLMIDYVDRYYPKMKLIGSLSKIIGLRWFHAADLEFNDQYQFLYMNMARLNIDQPLGSSKDSLLKFNVNIANPYKAGIGIKYLEDYLGSEPVKKTISEFYSENRLQLGTRQNFESILRKNANKNLDWFFEDYVNTRKKIDFKISKLKKSKDSLKVTIKNKRDNNMPVSLYGIKDDQIIYKRWVDNIGKEKQVTIPRNDAERIALNYEQVIPEYNQRNNFRGVSKLFNKPIQFRLLEDIEDPKYAQVFFTPEFDYNLYDGISIGPKMYNTTFLAKDLSFRISPKYGFNSNTVVGSANISYTWRYDNQDLRTIRMGIGGNRFSYGYDLFYRRYTPYLNFVFRPQNLRNNERQSLSIRNINVDRDENPFDQTQTSPNYNVFNVRYGYGNSYLVDRTSAVIDYQLAENFSKVSLSLQYRKLFKNNRQINLRFYGGTFIYSDLQQDADYFSFALDRPTDYLFDYNYYGRSEGDGLFSQQIIMAEGGFKSQVMPEYANQWITTVNASTNIWKWIFAYGDAGIVKNRGENSQFLYDSGVRVALVEDYFEVFFPVYSNLAWEIAQPDYDQKIRFIVSLDINTLIRLFTRRWY